MNARGRRTVCLDIGGPQLRRRFVLSSLDPKPPSVMSVMSISCLSRATAGFTKQAEAWGLALP